MNIIIDYSNEERKRCLTILKENFKEIKSGIYKEGQYDTIWISIGMTLFDMLDCTIDEVKEAEPKAKPSNNKR